MGSDRERILSDGWRLFMSIFAMVCSIITILFTFLGQRGQEEPITELMAERGQLVEDVYRIVGITAKEKDSPLRFIRIEENPYVVLRVNTNIYPKILSLKKGHRVKLGFYDYYPTSLKDMENGAKEIPLESFKP